MKTKAAPLFARSLKYFFLVTFFLASHTSLQACKVHFTYHNAANTDTVHFLASVTNATGYSWNFGDGTTGGSGTADPMHVYATPGKYNVCLTIKDSGMYCDFCDTVIVSGPLCNAHYGYYAVTHYPDSIHFGANPGFTQYAWTFGDGTTLTGGPSIAQHPFHLYKPGNYFPCLTVTSSGATCTYCDSVKIAGPSPCNARFINYALSGHPDSIHFYPATLTGTIYYWNFGDGSTSTAKDPWHNYKTAGNYVACLTVKDSGVYCNTCDTIKIAGSPPCDAHFSHYSSAANKDSVHFYPTSTVTASGYLWTFGDGTQSSDRYPWHLYKTPGTYKICLTIKQSGAYCDFCDTVIIPHARPCVAKFEYYHVTHNPDSVHFAASPGATSYYWSFGDGTHSSDQHPFHLYTAAGTYYACLSVNDSGTTCSYCDTVVIRKKVTCIAEFSHYSLTNPDSVHFYPTTTNGTSYSWSFGDGTHSTVATPWHLYKTAGSYSVCLTANVSGTICEWCDTITVRSVVTCNAEFIHYSHDSVHFYPNTTHATSYYWAFGDGTHSSLQDPWHLYKTAGTYDACLYVNDSGTYCEWCDTIVISGSTPCNAHFSHYSLANPDSVHFYPSITNATSYYWSFGDGTSSDNATPWHFYNAAGTYYACLTVNVAGVYCNTCDTIDIKSSTHTCNAQFTHYTLNNDSVHFYPPTTNATSYSWNFGDGSHTSTNINPWHVYTKPGTYIACLHVTNSGTDCDWCDTIVIHSAVHCNAEFIHYVSGHSDTALFYPAHMANGNIYYWNFGDGTTSTTGPTQQHVYKKPGNYTVCLYVNDSGTYCTNCDTIVVKGSTPTCNAEFVHYSTTNSDSIHFYPHTTNAAAYFWSFGDGGTSTSATPWHKYTAPGTYYTCLAVNDSISYCTWCDTIIIKGATICSALFGHYSLSNPDSVHFYPLATTAAISYYWSFSDGGSSTSQDPWHLFATPGIYYTCLTVTDSSGYCSFCDTLTIAGVTACDAEFGHYNRGTDSVYFYPTGAKAAAYYWSFGDGSISTDLTVWHTYKTAGTYYACLAVNDTGAYCIWCDTVHVSKATGIPAIQTADVNVQVYPNPMNEYAIVSIHNTANPVSFQIFDLLGRQVYYLDNIRDGIYTINTKNILQGLYYYTVVGNNQVVSGGRLIIVR